MKPAFKRRRCKCNRLIGVNGLGMHRKSCKPWKSHARAMARRFKRTLLKKYEAFLFEQFNLPTPIFAALERAGEPGSTRFDIKAGVR